MLESVLLYGGLMVVLVGFFTVVGAAWILADRAIGDLGDDD